MYAEAPHRAKVLKVVVIGGFVAVLLILEHQLQLSALLSSERIDGWLERAGPWAPLVFMAVMAGAIVVSPIPTLPLDALAGRLFGPLLGTLYAALGALLGALMSFHIARFLGREILSRFLKGHVNFCEHCSDKLLTKVVLFSRLLPFVSFDLVSYGAGLTKMSPSKFALATFLGLIPLTFIYTSWGAVFLASGTVAWIGALLVVSLFFLLPRWIEKYDLFSMRRFFEHKGEAPGDDATSGHGRAETEDSRS